MVTPPSRARRFFPTFYHHFGATNNGRGLFGNETSPVGRGQPPYGFPNDGLLNIRMLYSVREGLSVPQLSP